MAQCKKGGECDWMPVDTKRREKRTRQGNTYEVLVVIIECSKCGDTDEREVNL